MSLLNITSESLYISGGVLLFLIAVGMIFPGAGSFGCPRRRSDRGGAVHCAAGGAVGRRPFDHGHHYDFRLAAGTAWAVGDGVDRGLG